MTVSHGIMEELPLTIAARAVASAYASSGVLTDVSIGGLPFFYAVTKDQPYLRETNDYKRQQIDTSTEPGEQTLSQWWVRDQDSWHRGSGVVYYEPGSDQTTRHRCNKSVGIDVWTKGQVSLLKRTSLLQTAAGACYAVGARVSGTDVIFGVAGGTLFRHDGTTKTSYTGAPWTPSTEPAVAGGTILVGGVGGIMSGAASGSTLASLYTDAALVTPWWVKQRIIAAKGAALYELTVAGGGVALSTKTPILTHPDSSFTWTSVVDGPDCILAAGYSGGYGYIYAFNLITSGSAGTTPTLDQGVQVAEFPVGEEVYALKVYLGAFIAIGTSRGVRIGQIGQHGNITYGPLTVETTKPVRCLSSRGSYVHAGIEADIDGGSGCARINLSEEILTVLSSGYTAQSLRYAWAYDAQSHTTGAVYSASFLGNTDRVALAVNGQGIYLQSATLYETTGYVLSGRIRYATMENKTFSLTKVRCAVTGDSSVAISSVDSSSVERSVITLTTGIDGGQDLSLGLVEETPQAYISLRVTLNASGDGLNTPTMDSLQIKATPNPKIQRNIQIPLQCSDMEQDVNGQKIGYVGSAYIRLAALEQLENDNSVVQVFDRTSGESFSAQITKVRFIRITNPARANPNFGGVVVVNALKL